MTLAELAEHSDKKNKADFIYLMLEQGEVSILFLITLNLL